MSKTLFVVAALSLVAGCKKKEETSSTGGGGDKKPTETAAANLPALTAEPDPGAITAAEHKPMESVKFRMLAKRGDRGWPLFDAYNLGTKPITFLAIYGYAYDKDGKQVARTKVPLSWNGKLAPGGKTDWEIKVGTGPDESVPESAASYELCFNSLKFEGDASFTDDNAKCPEQKAKGA
jgi:hypothetical protein